MNKTDLGNNEPQQSSSTFGVAVNSHSPEPEPDGSQLSLFAPDQVVEQKAALPTPRRRKRHTAEPVAAHRSRRRTDPPAWPPHDRFPYNNSCAGQTVGSRVLEELRTSRSPLIITGYTSLSFVIDLLAHYRSQSDVAYVRLLLGHQRAGSPRPRERRRYQWGRTTSCSCNVPFGSSCCGAPNGSLTR